MKRCPSCNSAFPPDYTHCPRDGSALTDTGEWIQGTLIRGKYEILGRVGQGGMGTVYKATHVRFNELRALKVISAELASDAAFVRRFEQEAITTRKLQHPNAVRVEDIDEAENGRPFIVMEYIEGRNLKDVIEQEAPLGVFRVCSIIKQVAAVLDAAHALGIIHRDIKPGNIALVTSDKKGGVEGEQAKVFDFGIAKLKEDHLGSKAQPLNHLTLTGTGVVIGTPAYMSPEQARGLKNDQLDGRSDLYSLGVVMYQMLTGDLPLKADSTIEQLMAHINKPPKPIREARPDLDIPDAVAAVVMQCLEKNRELRPTTGRALADAVRFAEYAGLQLSSQSTAAPSSSSTSEQKTSGDVKPSNQVQPPAELRPSTSSGLNPQVTALKAMPAAPSRWRRWVWAAAAVVVVAAVAGNWWYLLREHRLRVEEDRRIATANAELATNPLPASKPAAGVVPATLSTPSVEPVAPTLKPAPPTVSAPATVPHPNVSPPATAISKEGEVKNRPSKPAPVSNQAGGSGSGAAIKPELAPVPEKTSAATTVSPTPAPITQPAVPPVTSAPEVARTPEPSKTVAEPVQNLPPQTLQRIGDRGRAWLEEQRDPPAINVNGSWDSEEWGELHLTQTQGNRYVSGNMSGYELTGVVSGKRLFLLIHSGRGKVDYCATLNAEADNRLSGGYSSRVTMLRFGHGLCQEKSRSMQMIKK